MDKFADIKRRHMALGMTQAEFLADAGINVVSWWRAREGKVGEVAQIKVIRAAETALFRLEVPMCSLCERRSLDPVVNSCEEFGCPMKKAVEAT